MAADGIEALEALRRQPYDLILMDLQMPGMDGLEATRRIRAELPAGRQPRIVALTANVLRDQREACRAAGMDDFVQKPFTFEDLRGALSRAGARVVSASEEPPMAPGSFSGPLEVTRLDSLRRLGELSGRNILREVLESFLAEAPRRLERMRDALLRGDAAELTFIAHSLKGSSAQIGAVSIADLSRDLEAQGRSTDLSRAAGLLDTLEDEIARVAPLLLPYTRLSDTSRPAISSTLSNTSSGA